METQYIFWIIILMFLLLMYNYVYKNLKEGITAIPNVQGTGPGQLFISAMSPVGCGRTGATGTPSTLRIFVVNRVMGGR